MLLLTGVIGVTGLLVWGCSSTAGQAPPASPSAPDAATQQIGTTATPAASPTVPGTHPARTAAAPERPAKRPILRARRAAPGKHAATPAHPGKHAARPAHPRGSCAPAGLVISLSESQSSYPQPASPQFTIYVVNTGPAGCTVDVSPRSLRLDVRSGPAHSWSPADCAGGSRPDMVRLARGVPLVRHVSWDRVRSQPGCPQPRQAALPGTYTVRVSAGPVHSQTDVFLLR